MKKLKLTFEIIVLCALTLTFINCTKKGGILSNPNFNYSTFTDSRDGKTYKSIKIGTQVWMAENLAYATPAESWNLWNDVTAGAKYGRLYTWEAAIQAIPVGWHLPTDDEWKILEMTLGMNQADADGINGRGTNEGDKLKAVIGWKNDTGSDAVGFSALPGGFRSNSGSFLADEYYGYWWSATEDVENAWVRQIGNSYSGIRRVLSYKKDAYSVRCVKD
jgi:uncharacterized protein (TIGR02145 family)